MRAIATSLLFKHNSSLKDVMSAASWRSRSTFVAFYLRDLGHRFMDISTLGPVIAAQMLVDPGPSPATPGVSSRVSRRSKGGAPRPK